MSSSPPVIKLSESLSINRANLEELLKRRFFFAPSFSIYGGVAGLYDYGPPGCAVKSNFLSQWRRHFVLEENMLEIDSPCLTPYAVLKTSGHVDRFQDLMVKDTVNGNCYRADHLLKEHIDKLSDLKETTEERKKELSVIKAKIDDYTCDQLAKILTDLEIKAPDTGNAITPPFPFNLMFQTSIGPTGQHVGFLRPETAQGIFVNFARLLELNGGKLPFAAATIGGAFRNEIAPRSGLLRVREFTLAEIEHFVHPSDKSHPKFEQSASQVLNLYPRKNQATTQEVIQLSVGEAVATGIINNQTLGYFMARVATFLMGSGIRKDGLRFRQHMENEMAHYACDCWDAELLTSYGWVECVGIADRSAYDLTVHSKATKARLSFHEAFPEPKLINVLVALPNKGLIGKTFKTSAKEIISHIEQLEEPFVKDLKCSLETDKKATLTIDNKAYELTPEMVNFQHKETKITGQAIIPSVIEPSFGVGRIIYSIFEQNYHVREGDAKRGYLSLPASIAPLKCSVLPLTGHADLAALIKTIVNNLISEGLPFKVDDSGTSIGRRYARTDEVGVPFGITIDFDSVKDNTVTLRERDSTLQVRIPIDKVAGVIRELCEERTTWPQVQSKYPKFESKDD